MRSASNVIQVETVCRSHKKAAAGLPDNRTAFQELSDTAGRHNVSKWTKQVVNAEKKRSQSIDVMDIYIPKEHKCEHYDE